MFVSYRMYAFNISATLMPLLFRYLVKRLAFRIRVGRRPESELSN